MSFFWNHPQFANSDFGPFFRFVEDVADQAAQHQTKTAPCHWPARAHFRPKFDVAETETAYELFGDLPGVAQQDLDVEFPDAQTLTVRGKVVRRNPEPAATQASAPEAVTTEDDASSTKGKQPSVEDDDEFMEVEKQDGQDTAPTEATKSAADKPAAPKFKFHALERKLGNFSRTFTFPAPVDTDAVHANLKDGVLSIVVPKSTKASAKKVVIQ